LFPYIWATIDWIGISVFAGFPIRLILRRVRNPERWTFIALLSLFPPVAGAVAQVDGYDAQTQLLAAGATCVAVIAIAFVIAWQLGRPREPDPGDPRGSQ
jgi:hypothetical protein